ncbi:conserved hypothetical protein [Bacillus spizizenii TU-B-10]|uniref:Uracil DNA glycosylase superfamily protein n=1 Tax=Bacillus spizizenii (strain DSM 15029 / JCM 12233 / NBRC 101239 / NRRL B-23049 / TU-B-10) TaxID=1052585 RepID=G4NWY8_BACS4|nr:conserved hypothetical protein [Bacillus spizizenii TU-B-10]GEK24194.1 hypothetical protein BSU04nite_05830 [Bacillus spizizenii]
MIVNPSCLEEFREKLHSLPSSLTKSDLLASPFRLHQENELCIYYSPHNEYINRAASIVIAGITPGFSQMKTAYKTAAESLRQGRSLEQMAVDTKKAAGLSGSMRHNLITMLDFCGLPQAFGIQSAAQLFGDLRHLLHTTSVIKYPVFIQQKNYTGYSPAITRSPILSTYAFGHFPAELNKVTGPALLIPLGKAAEAVCETLLSQHSLRNFFYLRGFPHPSGANGHRLKQFSKNKEQLERQIRSFASSGLNSL